MSQPDDYTLAAILTAVRDRFTTFVDTQRAVCEQQMKPGQKMPVDLDGRKLGTVLYTEPSQTLNTVDADAYRAWVTERYPDEVVSTSTPRWEAEAEIVRVLQQHAPHLVATTDTVRGAFTRSLVKASVEAGEPVGPQGETSIPGLALHQPRSQLRYLPTDTAQQTVMDAIHTGRLSTELLDLPRQAQLTGAPE